MSALFAGLMVALFALQIFDWASTRQILRDGGHEENRVMIWLLAKVSVDVLFASKTVGVMLCGYAAGVTHIALLAALVAFYVAGAWHNWRSL